jgi:Tol biopolymer transport system component
VTLSTGSKLGPYEILGQIGAGGMGEVYKARDTRLDRTVAVKVLPGRFAEDAEMRRRFEREARAISALSHPHICALYDVGAQDGVEYLVMEYLDGDTLADRLGRGPLPTDQALRFGAEIADALAAAHRAGIVHRDLKPGNVMLTKSGLKLLDFGLAKAQESTAAAESVLPTQARPLTERGTVLGTFQYMAPEQLEGKDADMRSDIFALGAVLYEMVTGKKAFAGTSQASLISAIMAAQPPAISSITPMAPPALDRVVQTCLAKDPEERWQSAGDVAKELRWIGEGSAVGVAAPAAVVSKRKTRERLAWVAAGLALAGALYLAYANRLLRVERPRPIHSFLVPPEKTAFHLTGDDAAPIMLSPDGERAVFGAGPQLWVQSLRTGVVAPLSGTEGGRFAFWSPDSRSIGFFANAKLKTKDVTGGPVQIVCDAQNARGGSWSTGGVIVFTPDVRSGVVRIPAKGGKPTPLTQLDPKQHTTHRWPWFLPDGQHVLYLAASHDSPVSDQNGIYVVSIDGKENRRLMQSDGSAQFASGGLLWVRDRSLMAQRFDPGALTLSGAAVRVQENVNLDAGTWRGTFSASENGILFYEEAWTEPGGQLVWFDSLGRRLEATGERGLAYWPRLSPDGRRAAIIIGDPSADIWIQELDRGVRQRATAQGQIVSAGVWSPDGSEIAFLSQFPDQFLVGAVPSNGAGTRRTILDSKERFEPTDWSPDGRHILCDKGALGVPHIWAIPVADPAKAFAVVETRFAERSGQFSPDGRWVAYRSLESGKEEIFVTPFPGGGAKWQVSVGGGMQPRWSRDGRQLYYVSTNNDLMAVDVEGHGARFETKTPRILFRVNLVVGPRQGYQGYDVAPDGKRFFLNTASEAEQPRAALVVNWDAELPR